MKLTNILFAFGFVFQAHSAIVMKRDAEIKPTTEDFEKCSSYGDYVPAYNDSSESFDCYLVSTQGPCKAGEWFLLDKDNNYQPGCYPKQCPEDEVFFRVNQL